jgi:hypothetical protein
MRRALLICALLLAGFPAAAGAASVRLVECVPAPDAHERSATFEARMREARGSDRMQVRFTLQVSEGVLPGWRRVAAPGLDQWLTSEPSVSRYSYSKTVLNLSAPAEYRMVVRFRWLDAEGEALRRSRATSRICRQPDMRPDLAVAGIDAVEGGYAVAVVNDGRTGSAPSSVVLAVGGVAFEPRPLTALEPGERRVVTVAGPACGSGDALTASVDPADAVDERDEADNALVVPCLA